VYAVHTDNQTIVKERIFLDKANPNNSPPGDEA
jgi:hypothetical protein